MATQAASRNVCFKGMGNETTAAPPGPRLPRRDFGWRGAVDPLGRLQAEFPQRKIRLFHVPPGGMNPKSAILQRLSVHAAGQVLVISDADIHVTPDYLDRVVAPLADPAVGVVTCPYRSEPSANIPSRPACRGEA